MGGALAKASWDNLLSSIHLFLGYCHTHHLLMDTTLDAYTDAQLFVAFISFLMARDVGKEHLLKQTEVAVRVLHWLQVVKLGQEHSARLAALREWVSRLRLQLNLNYVPSPRPSRDPADMELLGKWMQAPVLAARVEAVRAAALRAMDSGGKVAALEVAGLVHNAALAMMVFGYLPPIRPSCILSTTLPSYQGPCRHADCQHRQRCRGNRFEWQDDKLLLVLPHHKNTKHWGGAAIKVELPGPMVHMLRCWFDKGHGIVTRLHEEQPFVFVDLATGLGLHPESMAKVWSGIVLRGSGYHFGPQKCRSIFVQERRRDPNARSAGPSDSAAGHGPLHQCMEQAL